MRYSLHIALNGVNPNLYEGWDGRLTDAIFDGQRMGIVAKNNGFYPTYIFDSEATVSKVKSSLDAISEQSVKGDVVILTYSGHGGQVLDENLDENDRLDETFCLYDGQLIDDDINELLAKFKKGVNVLLISDSCNSGTIFKFKPTNTFPTLVGFFSSLKKVFIPKKRAKIVCNLVVFSGAKDGTASISTGKGGVLTNSLLNILGYNPAIAITRQELLIKYTLADWFTKAKKIIKNQQKPKMTIVGESSKEFSKTIFSTL